MVADGCAQIIAAVRKRKSAAKRYISEPPVDFELSLEVRSSRVLDSMLDEAWTSKKNTQTQRLWVVYNACRVSKSRKA
jgi:hypothetical protein